LSVKSMHLILTLMDCSLVAKLTEMISNTQVSLSYDDVDVR